MPAPDPTSPTAPNPRTTALDRLVAALVLFADADDQPALTHALAEIQAFRVFPELYRGEAESSGMAYLVRHDPAYRAILREVA